MEIKQDVRVVRINKPDYVCLELLEMKSVSSLRSNHSESKEI